MRVIPCREAGGLGGGGGAISSHLLGVRLSFGPLELHAYHPLYLAESLIGVNFHG